MQTAELANKLVRLAGGIGLAARYAGISRRGFERILAGAQAYPATHSKIYRAVRVLDNQNDNLRGNYAAGEG